MSEAKDPAIKLFGKTIQLPEITAPAADNRDVPPPPPPLDGLSEDLLSSPNSSRGESEKDASGEKLTDTKLEDGSQSLKSGEFTDPNASLATNENPKTPSVDNEASIEKNSKTEEEQSETNNSEEKTLKKPDKILPCPRCNSMETKFCYYNNYNVNQPRHFCKNCQRYWTAGGTMRSMPVGAGRRKNKNSASLYRHITVSEALQSGQLDQSNGTHHPTMKANGTFLTFGSNPPLCESMASVMKIAEKTMQNCSQNNGFHKLEELRKPVSYGNSDNGEDHSSESSITATDSKDEVGGIGFPPQAPCFPGTPWPYAWNSIPWNSPVPPPAFFPPGFPMPFYPASPYWGCPVPGPWNVHWVAPPSTSGPNSPTLGKHARDENEIKLADLGEDEPQKENNPDKCLWFPKTLRIDDPEEAARSSIWATLGIKNDEAVSVSGGGLFKPFQSKGGEKNHISEASLVLQANPAALSRSLNFRESS